MVLAGERLCAQDTSGGVVAVRDGAHILRVPRALHTLRTVLASENRTSLRPMQFLTFLITMCMVCRVELTPATLATAP